MYNIIAFWLFAIIIALFSILMIKFENIFYSMLCAIVVFFSTAGIFYILGSEYNAVIQVAVYGFAVPVILGLCIMFTDFKQNKENKNSNMIYLLILIGGLFVLAITYLIMTSVLIVPDELSAINNLAKVGYSIPVFSKGIFMKYVWAFELISLILTIIAAGLTLFKKEAEK